MTPLFCLHLLKSVLIRRPQNTFSQSKTPCMLLLLMSTPTHSFENGCCLDGVSSLGFLYFPPLPPFHAIQTQHIWRSLTSEKLWMQSWCSLLFKKLFRPIRTGRTVQPRKWLEEMHTIMQISTNNNSINAQQSTSLATDLHWFTLWFQ